MKDEILAHLDDPRHLEKMYRSNRFSFKREFTTVYPRLKGNSIADFWYERLSYEKDDINWGTAREFMLVLGLALLAGFIAKLPSIIPVSEEIFYTRNAGFIIFPFLSAYFAWKNGMSLFKIAIITGLFLGSLIFINIIPVFENSDSLILSCIHLPLFLWSVLGISFIGAKGNELEKRLGYLRYNGDLVVMTTLILIGGAILSGITIGLFALIGFEIQEFYFENVVIFCIPAAPIIATWITQANPQLVGKVSPVIAKIFSPLVLVMLVVYLAAMAYSQKDPYSDREFLLIFNLLLIGVMAIIFFSVAGVSRTAKTRWGTWVLFLLSLVTIIVNGIALSAILFRISEWGFTPNRAAVLGANVIILVNLLLVTIQLFKVIRGRDIIAAVERSISLYLPVYFIWTIIVTFIFPLVFGFR